MATNYQSYWATDRNTARLATIDLYAGQELIKADWNFYLAYNLFRLAAILQGIAKRVEAGTAASAQAINSAAGAKPLAQMAWQFAQRA